jgi:hypothetical protein
METNTRTTSIVVLVFSHSIPGVVEQSSGGMWSIQFSVVFFFVEHGENKEREGTYGSDTELPAWALKKS